MNSFAIINHENIFSKKFNWVIFFNLLPRIIYDKIQGKYELNFNEMKVKMESEKYFE